MKSIVFFALSLLVSVASAFHIVSPGSIVSCDPLTVQYDTTTGTAPFNLAFHNQTGDGEDLAVFTDITGTSYTLNQVPFSPGTVVVLILSDSIGKGSYTPPITVSPGSSDVCLNNPTSIPTIPTYTTSFSATSTFSGFSSVPPSSLPSGVSSSLSSLSSVISSANSVASSLSTATSPPQSSGTSGLGTSAGTNNAASVFAVAVISAIVNAILA